MKTVKECGGDGTAERMLLELASLRFVLSMRVQCMLCSALGGG